MDTNPDANERPDVLHALKCCISACTLTFHVDVETSTPEQTAGNAHSFRNVKKQAFELQTSNIHSD